MIFLNSSVISWKFFLSSHLKNYLFIQLCWVLLVACRIFDLHCGMWDLVPWPGIEPGPPALGMQSQPLDPQESPSSCHFNILLMTIILKSLLLKLYYVVPVYSVFIYFYYFFFFLVFQSCQHISQYVWLFNLILQYNTSYRKIEFEVMNNVILSSDSVGFDSGKGARGRWDHIRLLTYSKPGFKFNDCYISLIHPHFHTSNFYGISSRKLVCINVSTPWWVLNPNIYTPNPKILT